MAPVIGRLKKRPEFLRVASTRRKWVAPGLILQTRQRRPGEVPENDDGTCGVVRVGFTASRKVGGAVERNRARRRLRAAVAEVLPEKGQPGHDYVVIARSGTLTRPYRDLVGDLCQALARTPARAGPAEPAGRRRCRSRPKETK